MPFFSYANELMQCAPLVAYGSHWHACKKGIDLLQAKKTTNLADKLQVSLGKKFISAKIKELEQLREKQLRDLRSAEGQTEHAPLNEQIQEQ